MISLIWQVVIGLGLLLRKMKGCEGVAFPWNSVWERSLNKGRNFLKLSFHLVAVSPNLLSFLQLCPSTIHFICVTFFFPFVNFCLLCHCSFVFTFLFSFFGRGLFSLMCLLQFSDVKNILSQHFAQPRIQKMMQKSFLLLACHQQQSPMHGFYWVNSIQLFAI